MSNSVGDGEPALAHLNEFKSRWEETLNVSLPELSSAEIQQSGTVEEKISSLKDHLRTMLADSVDSATGEINASLPLSSVDVLIQFTQEANALKTLRMSCNEAGAAGVLLISGGVAFGAAGMVVGFAIGVELLLESCG